MSDTPKPEYRDLAHRTLSYVLSDIPSLAQKVDYMMDVFVMVEAKGGQEACARLLEQFNAARSLPPDTGTQTSEKGA